VKANTIEFVESSEGLKVKQSLDSPTVYLDHWAIHLLSDDRALQDEAEPGISVRCPSSQPESEKNRPPMRTMRDNMRSWSSNGPCHYPLTL
jgi:hypothetical protein